MSDARLTWGATSLVPETYPADAGYVIEASADGTNFGNPEAVVTAIRSSLQDGSLNQITSYQNRAGAVRMRVRSDTYDGLDDGGDALAAEQSVPGYSTLSWTPNAALARVTVWDVVYSTLEWEFDDLAETKVGGSEVYRYFAASFDLLPFGRSATAITVAASGGPAAPTTVSIDNGSSAANWSAPGALSLTSNGSYIEVTAGTSSSTIDVIRTGSLSIPSDTRIITVDSAFIYGTDLSLALFLQATTGGPLVATTLIAAQLQASGFTRYAFQVPASFTTTAAALVLRYGNLGGYGDTATLRIDQVSRTNVTPGSGSNRQQSRSLMVPGSARARASLLITAPLGVSLGELTILYTRTAPTGLQPPLRPQRVSGPAVTTGDATAQISVSGSYGAVGTSTPTIFTLPANRVREAAHLLAARLRATSAGTYTLTWTAVLAGASGNDIPETSQAIAGTTTVSFAAANTWQANEIGLLQLPTVPVASDAGNLVRLTVSASSTAVQWDEMWLFDLDNGDLTVAASSGLTRLEARSPDLANPERTIWGGLASGGTNAAMVRADWRTVPVVTPNNSTMGSLGSHDVTPGTVDIFTVTTGTDGSLVSATFFPAWLHTAGKVEAA